MQNFIIGVIVGLSSAYCIFHYLYHSTLRPRCERCQTTKDVKLAIAIDRESDEIYDMGKLCNACHVKAIDEMESRSLAELN